MAELTQTQNTSERIFGKKADANSCKLESTKESFDIIPKCPLVYVRYKDHVIYKNILRPVPEAAERETVGWLTQQNEEIMLIEHDRTSPNAQIPSGQGNGIILIKSSILEICSVPLQKISNCHLNSQTTRGKGEFALQPKKRKTQPETREG